MHVVMLCGRRLGQPVGGPGGGESDRDSDGGLLRRDSDEAQSILVAHTPCPISAATRGRDAVYWCVWQYGGQWRRATREREREREREQ